MMNSVYISVGERIAPQVFYQRTIIFYTSQSEKIRIARSEMEKITTSKVSIILKGLERFLLTSNDLRDLLAYLNLLKTR